MTHLTAPVADVNIEHPLDIENTIPFQKRSKKMNNPYDNQNNELINLINILSLVVGLQNMQENSLQSAQNNVQAANDRQAEYLMNEINRRFDGQNRMLERLIELMEK